MALWGPQLELSVCPVYAVIQAGVRAALSQDQPMSCRGREKFRFLVQEAGVALRLPMLLMGSFSSQPCPGASEQTNSSCFPPRGVTETISCCSSQTWLPI